MAFTAWKPATTISRGNVQVGITSSIANIEAPTLTEITTDGLDLSCSIQTQNGTSSTDSQTVDWLCDPSSETLPGSTTHTMDDLVIKSTGQEDDDLIAGLKVGQKIYMWRRDGLATTTAPAAGQLVWVWEVVITSIDPVEANNAFVGVVAHIQVQRRSKTAVAITA